MSESLYLAFEKFAKAKLLECVCDSGQAFYNETQIQNLKVKIILKFLEKHVIYSYAVLEQIYQGLPKKIYSKALEDYKEQEDLKKIEGWNYNKPWKYTKDGVFHYISKRNSIHEILIGISLYFNDLKPKLDKIKNEATIFDENPMIWDENYIKFKPYSVVNKFPRNHTVIFLTPDDCNRIMKSSNLFLNSLLILAINCENHFIATVFEEVNKDNEVESIYEKVIDSVEFTKEKGLKEVLNYYRNLSSKSERPYDE